MTSNCQGKGPKGAKLVTVATKLTKNIKNVTFDLSMYISTCSIVINVTFNRKQIRLSDSLKVL